MTRAGDVRGRLGTRRVAPVVCPGCGARQDAATCVTERGAVPRAGDLAVCFSCAELCAYDVRGSLRHLTSVEADGAARDPALQRFLAAAREGA